MHMRRRRRGQESGASVLRTCERIVRMPSMRQRRRCSHPQTADEPSVAADAVRSSSPSLPPACPGTVVSAPASALPSAFSARSLRPGVAVVVGGGCVPAHRQKRDEPSANHARGIRPAESVPHPGGRHAPRLPVHRAGAQSPSGQAPAVVSACGIRDQSAAAAGALRAGPRCRIRSRHASTVHQAPPSAPAVAAATRRHASRAALAHMPRSLTSPVGDLRCPAGAESRGPAARSRRHRPQPARSRTP